ncbi:TonB-dependent receptor [Chitinophaga arvensicola]|uniref:Iron complex outermembrane recepter protein n=1 Tax=Chitinophaga arvensicola TaxID=29529 RepID=A0A1I0RRH6_9BACT|nr:TonB-dependent receptor [Chitinophaga arvensicola]SEW43799.1 iron complex outermembrane recepter protein [Chitinophaga arvensicola]
MKKISTFVLSVAMGGVVCAQAPVKKERKSITDTTGQLSEIIVTASRVAESINDVPSSVTLISRAEVEKQAQINNNLPYILMQKVPGISPSEESQNNFIGKLRGRNFLVLIDGVPQSTPLRNGGRDLKTIDVSAIDHIEVINGASSMYGNGAAGGIINYITKKAVRNKPFSSTTYLNNSLNLAKTDGTWGYNVSQVFSGKVNKFDYLVQGKVARSGVSRSSDGEVISPFYGLGETDTYNALIKLGYDISDKHRVEVMGNYYNSIQDSRYIGTIGKFGISPAIGVRGDTNILGGTPYNKTLNAKYTGTYGRTEASLVAYYDDINSVFEAYNQVYSDHWGARLNFNTPFELSANARMQLIYGIDFLKDHTVQKDMKEQFVTPDMNMNSIAPYVQSKFVLAQDWILKAGVRYENLGFKVGDLTKGNKFTKGESNTYNALVFNAGARFNKLSYLQPFASFSQGFSIGDVGLVLRNNVPLNAINASPVKVNNVEVGVSGALDRFSYELTGYYSTTKKGTTYAETSTPGNYELSQVPQRIYGVEVVMNVKATDWLNLGTTVGYMDGRQDTKNDGNYNTKLDNSIISPVKVTGNAGFKITRHWDLTLQMANVGSRNVFPVAEYNYGKYPISGYTIFDAFTSYRLKNVTLNFSVNNLFNADYYPVHSEVRGATSEGRYYVKGTGAVANLGVVISL